MLRHTKQPVVLDFDQSVLPLPGERRITLTDHQETIRFGCRTRVLNRLGTQIFPALEGQDVIFIGSGDYHHITYLLLQRYAGRQQPIVLIVLDNHPDNMRYPWGVHCGSWVYHASKLPFIRQIHVLGITSRDIALPHAWENHLGVLFCQKVRYWGVGCNLRWLNRAGSRSFSAVSELLDCFMGEMADLQEDIYLSIDKDVLSESEVRTNWDQGVMAQSELLQVVQFLKNRLVGLDVVGEVSEYHYKSLFKRMLSKMDGQAQAMTEQSMMTWQAQHQAVNLALLKQGGSEGR